MKIAAIKSVHAVRPTDSGNTIIVEMMDGTGDAWTVLIPQAVVQALTVLLEEASQAATEQRRALGRP